MNQNDNLFFEQNSNFIDSELETITLLGCYKDNFEQTITLWDSSNATNIGHIPNDKRIDLMLDKKEAVSEFIDYWLNLKQPIEKLSPSGFISKL
tara:strand:+ start:409 stop:690 length:282 start_codon:yes stop_codon:yes gene_type:complete